MTDPAVLLLAALEDSTLFTWLESAFYPALFLVFVIASLGVPIPEDLPLILAGVLLHQKPESYDWAPTFLVSLAGIMSGDMVLYSAGRRWGRDVFAHKSVSWLITPERLERMTEQFHRHGAWMCFFGRLFMGVRAVMCLTAGVTRFPFWKFLLADMCGAMLSIPVFLGLGYFFANSLPTLSRYLGNARAVLVIALIAVAGLFLWYELIYRRRRANRRGEHSAAAALKESPPLPQRGGKLPSASVLQPGVEAQKIVRE